MKLSAYETDTLLMAIRFQLANDHEIIDTEWNDLISMRDKLEAYATFKQVVDNNE